MKSHYKYQISTLVLLLLPFFIVSFYNVPSADDLVRTDVYSISTYFELVAEWYNNQNGRYFNVLISYIPLWYIPQIYKLVFVIFFSFFTFTIYRLLVTVFHKVKKLQILLISLFVVAFFLISIPKVVSAFYWFAALTAYLFSFSIYLLLLRNLIKILNFEERKINLSTWIYTFLLVFIGNGSHEVTMIIIDFTVFLFLLYTYKYVVNQKKKKLLFLFFLNAFAFLCSMAVYFSPGSNKRMGWQGIERDYLVSLENSIISSINYIYTQVFMTPIFLVSSMLLLIFFSSYFKDKKPRITINPLISGLIVFAFVSLPSFVYYHSVGHFSITYGHRTLNLVYFYFVLIWVFFIYNLVAYFKQNNVVLYENLKKFNFITPFLLFYLFFAALMSKNYKNAASDWWQGTAKNYNIFWNARIEYVRNYKGKDSIICIPKIPKPPKTIFFDDITNDVTHWKNDFFKTYTKSNRKIVINDAVFMSSSLQSADNLLSIDDRYNLLYLYKNKSKNYKLLPLMSKKQLVLFALKKADVKKAFYLHVYPKNKNNLTQANFNNLDFMWGDSKKIKFIPLPEYEITKIMIGQFDAKGRKWQKTYIFDASTKTLKEKQQY